MVSQTAKETIYTAKFRRSLEASNQPAWLKGLREDAFNYFTENGFPTVKNEAWKYTNVAPAAAENFGFSDDAIDAESLEKFTYAETSNNQLVFMDGKLNLGNSSLPQDLAVLSFGEALRDENFARIIKEKLATAVAYDANGFAALNTAFLEDGTFLYLPKNAKIEQPVHFLYLSTGNRATFPRILVVAESFAEATIVESYARDAETKYLTSAVVEIFLADEAKLKHFRVQRESHEAHHIGATAAEINRGSVYDTTNINLGGKLSRHDIRVRFNAEAGEAFVDGLYMLNENQHHDTHSIIDHALPNCNSHQTYKGVLNDKSRGVFNGIVFVRENASGTDAKQSNKNLLLSNDARIDTKPQLEIFNDDVKCAHGATVGQLEEEELFYLLSRGLSENLAKNLLTYGFAEEIINKIEIESIKKALDEAVLNRLNVDLGA